MERFEDITELLNTINEKIKLIEEKYNVAKNDEMIKSILRPEIKSTLEHLRSILEYSIQDICTHYNIKKNKIYFPYGEEKYFRKNIKTNFSFIDDKRIYTLIESLQDFKSKNKWLIELCRQTNFNKHIQLSKQIRTNSLASRTNIGNLISIDNSSSITLKNCSLNGINIGENAPVHISGEMSKHDIQNIIDSKIPISKEFDWVEFRFENSTIDTLDLIKKSYININKFVNDLKNLLTN
jgi:hypothetical protein